MRTTSSKCLHESEWLDQAKRLHVGESLRVYHGAERRPNMVVSNKQDKYTAWCFSCNKGGVKQKEMVRFVQPAQIKERPALSADPGLCWPVGATDERIQREVIKHLQSKQMSLPYLQQFDPQYSFKDQRLVLRTPECLIGRDLTGQSKAKWHTYTEDVQYARARFADFKGATVVLTEDLYSAAKIAWYCPTTLPVACLGTRISAALMTKLLQAAAVVTWFDGDEAGDTARLNAGKALSLMDIPYRQVQRAGDPKDYAGDHIQRAIYPLGD
jgi:hypothetical protein